VLQLTTTAKQCIATISSNAYQHERSCHDLIILSLPVRLYTSQLGGSCVKHIAVLHLTVGGCTSLVYCTYNYNDDWLWLPGSNVTSYVSM